ncbi:MAG: RNA-binding transcriptional accessory protein [Myxococcales bacterium]|nr:RNA-binding transcriptional accessory protein [Myxococcales bacterium]
MTTHLETTHQDLGAATSTASDAPAKEPAIDGAIVLMVAKALGLPERSVRTVVALLVDGATVPFIARYRKEATGGLDEVQIRDIETQKAYFTELEQRRASILEEIAKQGKLTDELRAKILACTQKSELEDLYLPFKPKRRTRAMIAKEMGLEPLALRILAQPLDGDPLEEAKAFVAPDKGVGTAKIALQGARDIVAEAVAERAEVRQFARRLYMESGVLVVEKAPEVNGPTKFETWYDFREPVKNIASHRFLAVKRGETENVLRSSIEVDVDTARGEIALVAKRDAKSPWAQELDQAITDAWKRLIAPSVESEVRVELKLSADKSAVDVFASNLRSLLLAAPLGAKTVIGIDPGQRTGCKTVVIDSTGRILEHTVLFLVQGDDAVARSRRTLAQLIAKYTPMAIAVGNGTHGRETEQFVRDALRESEQKGIFSVLVNEAGASVYSASDVAREEFPDLDLTVRGAISIARRLQDPLAELVKVDPKSIGVGQYQHDVFQPLLAKKLDEVVESCVNLVGVELNTASAPLLAKVAGIGPSLAKRIVGFREANGRFVSRKALTKVTGLGPKTFEQCAGFVRVRDGEHPLDASAVHPERYALVEQMAKDLGVDVAKLVGNDALVAKIDVKKYVQGDVGEPTLKDILAELKKPGRDPRDSFEPPSFRDDVRTMDDLKPGMALEGVVTNVTAFGAFVDIGVHQDGLVHVSQLSDRFVKDPSEVVKAGDKLKVRVIEVDMVRKRISLTARSGEGPKQGAYGKSDAGGRDGNRDANRDGRGYGGGNRGGNGGRPGAAPVKPPAQGKFTNNPFERLLKK